MLQGRFLLIRPAAVFPRKAEHRHFTSPCHLVSVYSSMHGYSSGYPEVFSTPLFPWECSSLDKLQLQGIYTGSELG